MNFIAGLISAVNLLLSTVNERRIGTSPEANLIRFSHEPLLSIENGPYFDSAVSGEFTPLERVVLTTIGNLQLTMSAFYGGPVTVRLDKFIELDGRRYDREVTLVSNEKIEILGEDSCDLVQAVKRGEVAIGLGQLIRYLGRLPSFKLLEAKKIGEPEQLFRKYLLYTPELRCVVEETFEPDFLESNTYFYSACTKTQVGEEE